jgi:hypothetical protein
MAHPTATSSLSPVCSAAVCSGNPHYEASNAPTLSIYATPWTFVRCEVNAAGINDDYPLLECGALYSGYSLCFGGICCLHLRGI